MRACNEIFNSLFDRDLRNTSLRPAGPGRHTENTSIARCRMISLPHNSLGK
jgi:hypothetical protein